MMMMMMMVMVIDDDDDDDGQTQNPANSKESQLERRYACPDATLPLI